MALSNPYKFNGKELDTETGLAYYGARYYSPELSVWYGVDPLMEKYPQNGAYVFCNANPVRYIDPDGQGTKDAILKALPDPIRQRLEIFLEENPNIKLENLAVGVEYHVGTETTSGVKVEASAFYGNVVFLGGEDAGYVYSYYGGEAGVGAETSVGANVNISKNYFIAYATTETATHNLFQGDYTYNSVGAGISMEELLGISGNISFAEGTDWNVVSLSGQASIGAGVSTPISIGITYGKGKVTFFNNQNVGEKKSYKEILSSMLFKSFMFKPF